MIRSMPPELDNSSRADGCRDRGAGLSSPPPRRDDPAGPLPHRPLPAARRLKLCLWPLALLLAWSLLNSSVWAEAVYSKTRRFRIPFQFDRDELQRLGAKEIQLFVSSDRGRTWQRNESVSPDAGRFTFEAAGDGEYWFSVKTIAAGGLTYPAGPHQPGLQVRVDATAPKLELQLQETEPGRVKLTWSADDEHLDLSTLKLEASDPGASAWEPLSLRAERTGQTTWTVRRPGTVQVRGSVDDLAGNRAEAETRTGVNAASDPEDARPDFSRPVAADEAPLRAIPADPPVVPIPQLSELAERQPIPRPLVKGTAAPKIIDFPGTDPPAVSPQASPSDSRPRRAGHLVNSNSFRIGYRVEEVGPSGVARVDLYITEDGGRRWYHYGSDPDRQSPFQVKVPRDGEYGFSFRITSGVGLAAVPPQPGEAPEITVVVDREPPVAKLSPLRLGQSHQQVVIEWEARDRELAERPISLYFATRPNASWEPIQVRHPNTGRFVWTVPDSVEEKLYVRLEARDAAGNVTRVEMREPFLIDRSRPRAQVTEVESLKSEAN